MISKAATGQYIYKQAKSKLLQALGLEEEEPSWAPDNFTTKAMLGTVGLSAALGGLGSGIGSYKSLRSYGNPRGQALAAGAIFGTGGAITGGLAGIPLAGLAYLATNPKTRALLKGKLKD